MLVYCQHEAWCVLQRYVPCVFLCSQPLGSMLFHGVHTIGIVQSLHFKCNECPHEATLNRPTPLSCSIPCDITSDSVEDGEATESGGEDEGEDNGEMVEVDIEEENLRLVLGCILCGRGRVDCSKLLAMLDLPDLSYRQWTKGLKILSHCVGELSESSMRRRPIYHRYFVISFILSNFSIGACKNWTSALCWRSQVERATSSTVPSKHYTETICSTRKTETSPKGSTKNKKSKWKVRVL